MHCQKLRTYMETGRVVFLPARSIRANPAQPRKIFREDALQELADSIRTHGILQPLTVRQLENGYYQIIAGERRWRAARIAELREIPAVIIEADDKKVMELALIENLQRQDLNPVEEAMGYQTLMGEYGLTQEETAARVGKSRPAVANMLRLLTLEASVLEMLRDGRLTAGHARAILKIKAEKKQLEAAQKGRDKHSKNLAENNGSQVGFSHHAEALQSSYCGAEQEYHKICLIST